MIILNPKGDINLHTHTCYCDGKDKPEEIVQKAIDSGFRAIGFSGHEYSPADTDFCMSLRDTEAYCSEILELKRKYKGEIDIYLGIERDYFGPGSDYPYDYVIGSAHSVKAGDALLTVDHTEDIMVSNVEKYFGGDYRAYVESYYDTMADVLAKTGADIVGHFDLVTKFNEGGKYFDEDAVWYKKAALKALGKVVAAAETKGVRPIFEINTGAMARGYRSKPYPADFILEEIERLQCPVILSSDCHDMECLNFGFIEIIKSWLK